MKGIIKPTEKKEETITAEELHAALRWQTVPGFIELFQSHTDGYSTYYAAYEAAEKEYFRIFKKRRYKDFLNFSTSKWKYNNRQKRNQIKTQKHKNTKSNESKNPGPTGE